MVVPTTVVVVVVPVLVAVFAVCIVAVLVAVAPVLCLALFSVAVVALLLVLCRAVTRRLVCPLDEKLPVLLCFVLTAIPKTARHSSPRQHKFVHQQHPNRVYSEKRTKSTISGGHELFLSDFETIDFFGFTAYSFLTNPPCCFFLCVCGFLVWHHPSVPCCGRDRNNAPLRSVSLSLSQQEITPR